MLRFIIMSPQYSLVLKQSASLTLTFLAFDLQAREDFDTMNSDFTIGYFYLDPAHEDLLSNIHDLSARVGQSSRETVLKTFPRIFRE